MLIGAGVRAGGGPMRQLGAPLAAAVERNTWAQAGALRNLWAGQGTVIAGASIANKSGIPDGALHPTSWLMPPKAGGMSARYTAAMAFDSTGLAVGGITTTGTASFVIDFALATGGLIASGTGTAAFTFDAVAAMTGSVSGDGSAAMSITFNSPILGAIAETTGAASFVITGALVPYAIGHMTGTTDVTTELTADQVAAATVAALAATTIPVDVRKVNAIDVDGSGTEIDPWGPA
ncbi:MAG: hypothetical protein RJA36_1113 [Pseudomonadota bacterium]|jgi:hypothetical protein